MRHIQKFSSSGEVQTSLDEKALGKPYVALVSGSGIDWNTQDKSPSENWVDLRTIDNNTPIYNIAWKDGGFSNINDTWFSEKSGLTTDNYVDNSQGWRNGKTSDMGYFTYHRMSSTWKGYTCTFLTQYYSGNGVNVEYGKSVSDAVINTLPVKEINGQTYYALNIVDWENWKPLYMPLSTSKIISTYIEGGIMVDIAPKE